MENILRHSACLSISTGSTCSARAQARRSVSNTL